LFDVVIAVGDEVVQARDRSFAQIRSLCPDELPIEEQRNEREKREDQHE
jgi:hypothetical protein